MQRPNCPLNINEVYPRFPARFSVVVRKESSHPESESKLAMTGDIEIQYSGQYGRQQAI